MDTFKQLAAESKLEAMTELKNGIKPISLKDLMAIEFPPIQWRIDKLVPLEGITIFSGAPGAFKTWIILQMALDIVQEKPFLGQFPTRRGNVLMIDEESHQRFIRDRLRKLGSPDDLPIYFLSQNDFLVTDGKMMTAILEICAKYDIDTIFIDSLIRIHRSNENDAGEMAEVFRLIRTFCREKKTVILTHHERKENGSTRSSAQNRMRGSSDIEASVDSHLAVGRITDDRYRLILEQPKSRQDMEIAAFELRVHSEDSEDGKVWFENLGEHDGGKQRKEEAKETILNILREAPDGLNKNEVTAKTQKFCGIGGTNIKKALNELIREEVVQEKKGAGNTKICFLVESSEIATLL